MRFFDSLGFRCDVCYAPHDRADYLCALCRERFEATMRFNRQRFDPDRIVYWKNG